MGKLTGKSAFVTGAARGQGRSHAVRFAEEGANVIAVDFCHNIDSVGYPLATGEDLEETVRLIEKTGQRAVAARVDVRDHSAVEKAMTEGVEEFGRLDVVVANAGILSYGSGEKLPTVAWKDVIDVNLTGAFNTAQAAIPHLRATGSGGSIVLTSSALALRPVANLPHYISAKAGLVGLMRALALELAPHSIRVNSIHPSIANTEMVHNKGTYELFAPHIKNPTREDVENVFATLHKLPTPWVEVEDITAAVLFLASDDARFVTGQELKIDAGAAL